MDLKLELIQVPVSDVDRAKDFYVDVVGFSVHNDVEVGEDIRFVQLDPPGTACSIVIGKGLTRMRAGSIEGLLLVTTDIEASRAELVARGVEATEVEVLDWASFFHFSDPDGNGWSVQQLP